jgi:hypothetical protein
MQRDEAQAISKQLEKSRQTTMHTQEAINQLRDGIKSVQRTIENSKQVIAASQAALGASPQNCPVCGSAKLTAMEAQGTAQCVPCGAVFTYPR